MTYLRHKIIAWLIDKGKNARPYCEICGYDTYFTEGQVRCLSCHIFVEGTWIEPKRNIVDWTRICADCGTIYSCLCK